jgi:hypothetical protein
MNRGECGRGEGSIGQWREGKETDGCPLTEMCRLQRGIGMVPTSKWCRPLTCLVADFQGCTYDLEQISLACKGRA